MQLTELSITLLIAAVLLGALLTVLIRRRKSAKPAAQLRKACREMLTQVYLPDGEDGQIHIEYLLLCPRGVVVINVKEVSGNVFGSDAMTEWAVITPAGRSGIRNPQDGLFDRLAAVKRLVPDVPVEGFIAFTPSATFTKGIPSHVAMFDDLVAELQQEYAQTSAAYDAFLPGWDALKAAAEKA